jgi:integrase
LNHLGVTVSEQFALEQLRHADLQRHIDRRRDSVASTTIKKEIDTFRAAWNWAVRSGIACGKFPSAGLVYPKGDEKSPFMTFDEIDRRIKAGAAKELWDCLYLSHDEVGELLNHVQGLPISAWIYPAFVLTAHTGARRSEMMRAKPEDVDLTGAMLTIRERKRMKGQRTTRRVPLSNQLVDVLKPWLAERTGASWLFSDGTEPLLPQSAQKAFERGVKGSKWDVMRGWHVLRHSFISALASRGVDQRLIDDFVGHQTEEQRRRYRHLYPSTQHEAIQSVFG